MGGTLRAIETGYIQNEIQNAAYDYQRDIETRRAHRGGGQPLPAGGARAFRPSGWIRRWSARRWKACAQVRASRSQRRWRRNSTALERAARDGANLMPPILDAADAYATVGEISDRLRGVFGEYREA